MRKLEIGGDALEFHEVFPPESQEEQEERAFQDLSDHLGMLGTHRGMKRDAALMVLFLSTNHEAIKRDVGVDDTATHHSRILVDLAISLRDRLASQVAMLRDATRDAWDHCLTVMKEGGR